MLAAGKQDVTFEDSASPFTLRAPAEVEADYLLVDSVDLFEGWHFMEMYEKDGYGGSGTRYRKYRILMSANEDRIAYAKSCFARTVPVAADVYETVLKGVAANVKMGPFTATSGVVVPYYLNATTNFLDKKIAPHICTLFTSYLETLFAAEKQTALSTGTPVVCVGMEVAGGVLTSQLAALAPASLIDWMDFLYIRKKRKTSGTCQQLEGPQSYTSRTADSPPVRCIVVDDALSTGSSLLEQIDLLKNDYNMEVVGALYLVDRTKDRENLPPERQKLAFDDVRGVDLHAIFDLDSIDQLISKG